MRSKPKLPILQRGHPLARGLVGAWLMYEGSGVTLVDLSGYGNDSDLTRVTWSGTTIEFDGNDWTRVPRAVVDTPPLSFFCRFNSTSVADGQTLIILEDSVASDWIRLTAQGNADDDQIRFQMANDNSGTFADTSAGYLADTWHTAAGTITAAREMTVYLDGGNTGSATAAAGHVPTNLEWTTMGRWVSNNAHNLNGLIDIALVYNRALTANEVRDLDVDPYQAFRPSRRWWPVVFATEEVAEAPAEHDPRSGFRRRIIVTS